MGMIVKNMLVEQRDEHLTYRVIDVVNAEEVERDDGADYVVLFDTDAAKQTMPQLMRQTVFLERLGSRTWHVAQDTQTSIDLHQLTAAENHTLERRWAILREALKAGPRLYIPLYRSELAQRFVREKVAARSVLYNILRLYWRYGDVKQALIPEFKGCGAPGTIRVAISTAQKVGRKRTVGPGVGLAITNEHRQNMTFAIAKSPFGKEQRNLDSAYNFLLTTRYPEYVRVDPKKPDSRPVIEFPDCVPSYEQFFYYWKTRHSFGEHLKKRLSRRGFEALTKLLLSGTLKEVRGPGARYYIDSTVLDVYVVSRFNPNRIIGRPTLYLVVDAFSRLIVGFYLGLEPPCWVGAMLALWNCNLDKVVLCAKYGIPIAAEWWPTGYMPLHLMGDRGELASPQAEALSDGFRFDVENARPYSGDAKGVVERPFGTIQQPFGPWLPGWVDKNLEKDADPSALSAALNPEQITRVIITNIIKQNHRVIRGYEGAPEQIVEGVEFTPIALWDWGVRNLRYEGRRYTDDHLVRYLWPEHKLKFTRKGLKFYRGLWYMAPELRAQPWFLKALYERQECSARFHPLHLDRVYLLPPEPHSPMVGVNVVQRSAKFSTQSLSELAALASQRRRQDEAAKWDNRPIAATMDAYAAQALEEGRAMARAARDESLSKAERLRGLRANRAEELHADTERALESAFRPRGSLPPTDAAVDDHPATEATQMMVEELLAGRK